MKKILIVNLDLNDDVLNLAYVIESLKTNDPSSEICTLTDERYHSQVNILAQANQHYFIDTKEIQKVLKQRIFSDFEAVNSLWSGVKDATKQNWDLIINLSSSEAASFLVSIFKTNKLIGNYKTPEKTTIGNNIWARFHFQGEKHQTSGLHQIDSFHRVIGISHAIDTQAQINSDSGLNTLAHKNINRIRQSKGPNPEKTHIVGIQLENEGSSSAISLETICELIEEINTSANLIPVIISLRSENNNDLIKKINQKFNNSVVIIETDFLALTSIIINLDSVLVSTNSFRILADLLETPNITVTNNSQNVHENFSSISGNLTIYCSTIEYPLMRGRELALAVEALATNENSKLDLISNQLSVYQSGILINELWNRPIAGGLNQVEVLHLLAKRILVHNINNENTQLNDIVDELETINEASAYHWINKEKNALSSMVKTTLAALRTIRTAQNNVSSQKEFIANIDEIMCKSYEDHLVSLIAYSLKNKLDTMNGKSSQENLIQTENFLLELKSQVGLVASLISDIAEHYSNQKKERTISKSRSISN